MKRLVLTPAECVLVQSWRELLTPLGCEAKLHSKVGRCGKRASHVHVDDPDYQPWRQPRPRALLPVCYYHADQFGNSVPLESFYGLLDNPTEGGE